MAFNYGIGGKGAILPHPILEKADSTEYYLPLADDIAKMIFLMLFP
jgi:hypothetical protein